MAKEKGVELAPLNPGWIKKVVPENYALESIKEIIIFYVINTPCENASSSAIPIQKYGWKKDVWKNNKLKDSLYSVASLERENTLSFAKEREQMKKSCEITALKSGFHKDRSKERIVAYKGRDNEIISIFRHIRNALAHGRLAIYRDNDEIYFAFEDGVKKEKKLEVRARMILKESTLIKWKEIIESGELPEKEENL